MKKILLATTLLAASTGFAAAEVAVGGSARMGVISDGSDIAFTSRVRVSFTMTGETDNGLSFGASVRADQSGQGNTNNGDSTVYISGAFGKVTMGDTGNAADALVGQVGGVGLTGLGDMNEIGFLGKDVTGVLYEYSAGALTFALGAGQTVDQDTVDNPDTVADETLNGTDDNGAVSIAVKYSTDAYSVALGYEANDSDKQLSLLGSATFSGATVKVKLADKDSEADMAYALSVGYAISGANVTAFYADKASAGKAYGIGASYDLGGGASVVGGIARAEGTDAVFDLGVSMSF
jgi:outer membrane protein OmpU